MTTGVNAVFVDTNILTCATIIGAPLRHEAQEALDQLTESGAELWISAQVIREYMVNTPREQSYSQAIAMPQVLEQIKRFCAAFKVAEETAAVLDKMLELAATTPLRGKQIQDVNIVATMITYNIPALLTHTMDDFKQFMTFIRVIALKDSQ